MKLDTTIASTPYGRVRYYKNGKGVPIVFLHGYPDNLQIWSNLVPRLQDEFTTLAFDWPGMGESDEWKGGTTPVEQAKRLIKLMDHFNLPQAHLVGHDMGTQPALVAAALYPQRILSVTVMNGLLIWNAKTSWEINFLRKLKLNQWALRFFPQLVFNRAIGTFGSQSEDFKQIKADLWASFKKLEVRKFIVRLCAGYQAQLPRLIRYYEMITCPVHILWGKNGKHFDVEHAHTLHALIPHSGLELMDNATHWMAFYQAGEVAQNIQHFIHGIDPPSAAG